MSIFSKHEYMYSKTPLSVGDNRDENIIVDVLGNWIPECELLYYGLLNSRYSDILYKLKNSTIINPRDVYLDTCYFSGDDLIRYLASTGDSLNTELSEEFLEDATNTAFNKYMYVPCSETMLRHSLIELAYYDFVKSITLVYPWDIRDIDYQYLKSIIPHSRLHKFIIVSGNIVDFIERKKDQDILYTTIISNSLEDVNRLIDNSDDYRTKTSFFLLRNHSENLKFEIKEDPLNSANKKIDFIEIGTEEIYDKLMDSERLIPKTQMRFARYEPLLFSDAKPNPEEFNFGN